VAARWIRLLAVVAGVAVALTVGGWAGVPCGTATAVVLALALPHVEPASRRRERARAAADLPFAVDLLSAALRTGAPPDRAAITVGEALGGPIAAPLVRVGRALRFGTPAAQAWHELDGVPGAERLIRAAVRSAERGTALSPVLDRLTEDLRTARAAAADAAARRAGVLCVLPLGLCFLPAFLLAGVVPVVVAVMGDVLTIR
jgi:Flp pilus assembly protein TadB